MGISRVIAEGDWLRSIFTEAIQQDYTLAEDKIHRQVFPMVAVTDNKPVYDHCIGNGVVVKNK